MVADVLDHRQVVGDEQEGDPVLALQPGDQVQHLRAHRNVQRRDRLVGDDQLRVQRQGARDADALPLPAGKLVRVAVEHVAAHADHLQQLLDLAVALGGRADAVYVQRLTNGLRDRAARAQRGEGVLEDDLHLAAHLEPARGRGRGQVLALEDHLAAGRLLQLQDRAAKRRLAAARLADQAERLAEFERKAHAVDRLHLGDDPAQETAPHGEVLLQVPDFKQGGHGVRS